MFLKCLLFYFAYLTVLGVRLSRIQICCCKGTRTADITLRRVKTYSSCVLLHFSPNRKTLKIKVEDHTEILFNFVLFYVASQFSVHFQFHMK
jgi:hypothetical protein